MLGNEERRTAALGWLRGLDVVVVAATLGAAVLRLWGLGDQSLWYDEWLTTEAVSGSVLDVVEHVANREGAGPTYFLVMWGWVRVFGHSDEAFRMVSALFGIATVPVAYRAVRELGLSQLIGRTTAVVIAVHPMLVWYSQEARAYSLLAFLCTLSLVMLARARASGSTRDLLLWGLVCALALSVHNFAVFLVVGEAVLLLVSSPATWRRVALGCTPVAATLLLLAPMALEQRSHDGNSEWISDFPLSERLADALESLLVGPNSPIEWLWIPVAVLVAVAVALLLLAAAPAERTSGAAAGAIGIGAAVLATVVTAVVGPDVLLGRYLMPALVPLVIAVSVGLAARRAPWLSVAAVAVFAGISLSTVVTVGSDTDMHKADWRSVAAAFVDGDGDSDGGRVLVVNRHGLMASPLRHYLDEPEEMRRLRGEQVAEVEEIDVVFAKPNDRPCSFLIGRECALVFLGAPLSAELSEDFVLYDEVELEQFVIQRYRAEDAVQLTAAEVVAPADPRSALVLVTGACTNGEDERSFRLTLATRSATTTPWVMPWPS